LDAGALLLGAVDRAIGLIAECFIHRLAAPLLLRWLGRLPLGSFRQTWVGLPWVRSAKLSELHRPGRGFRVHINKPDIAASGPENCRYCDEQHHPLGAEPRRIATAHASTRCVRQEIVALQHAVSHVRGGRVDCALATLRIAWAGTQDGEVVEFRAVATGSFDLRRRGWIACRLNLRGRASFEYLSSSKGSWSSHQGVGPCRLFIQVLRIA
jgi:hypothetical protein